MSPPSLPPILTRALAIWLVLIAAEVLHGITRAAFLIPYVGEFRSNQISVFTGSMIILVIALIFVRWIDATRPSQLLMVGAVWLGGRPRIIQAFLRPDFWVVFS